MNRIRIGVVRTGGEGRGKGIVGTVLTVILGAVAIVGAVLFSVVILAVALVVGAVLVGYFWWRTRHVRRQLREQILGKAAGRCEIDLAVARAVRIVFVRLEQAGIVHQRRKRAKRGGKGWNDSGHGVRVA